MVNQEAIEQSIIDIDEDGRCTYINNAKKEMWPEWKLWSECSEEEKRKVNLITPSEKYIVFDKDMGEASESKILEEYKSFKEKLLQNNINFFIADRSPKGFHVFAPFDKLHKLDEDTIKEIRKRYVKMFNCDEAKVSLTGVISLPNRPHFKTGVVCGLLDNIQGMNHLKDELVIEAETTAKENKAKVQKACEDMDFNDYFQKDPFFLYLNSIEQPMPTGMGKNNIILKNLAIAASKTGKGLEDIEKIIRPMMKRVMPDKNFNEFLGWYKKALAGDIGNYNKYELNTWTKTFSPEKKEYYEMSQTIETQLLQKYKKTDQKFITDTELEERQDMEIEWIVDKWIPKGDICFVAGKAASFKTTLSLHLIYAIAHGKLAFNKYATKKCKVLYINEENQQTIYKKTVKRIKKGLDIEDSKSNEIYHSIMENLRLDQDKDLKIMVDFINANNIEVIVFDSFRRFFVGKENEADVVSEVFNKLKLIRILCNNPTIIVLHHTKKDNGESNDIRDSLRGSSDIVNSADSIIGIKRQHGKNLITIEHIKNRAGEELIGKVVKIESGEENDLAYIYETNLEADTNKIPSKPEKCAEKLLKFLEDKKLVNFGRKDLSELSPEFSHDTITKALKILCSDGLVNVGNAGKYVEYHFNLPKSEESYEPE